MSSFFVALFVVSDAAGARAIYSDTPVFQSGDAVADLQAFLKQRPTSAMSGRAHLLLGLAYLRQNRPEEATLHLQLAQGQLPEIDDYVTYQLGEALFQAKNLDSSARVLGQFLRSKPESTYVADVRERLAHIYWAYGHGDTALDSLSKLIGEVSDDARVVRLQMTKADWLTKLGKKLEAVQIYKLIWNNYPQFAESETAQKLGKALLESAAMPRDTVQEKLTRARELTSLGRYEEADGILTSILSDDAGELDAHRRSSILFRRAGLAIRRKLPEVSLELTELLLGERFTQTTESFRHDVLRLKAKAHSQLFDFAGAAAIYGQVAGESRNKRDKRDALLLQAVLVRDSGDLAGAEKLFDKFVKQFARDKKVIDARWFWGWTLFREGRLEGALGQWKVVLADAPDGVLAPRVTYWMGRIAEQRRQLEEAGLLYRKVSADDPWSYYGWLAAERLTSLSTRAPAPSEQQPKISLAALEVGEVAPPWSTFQWSTGDLPTSLASFTRASTFWQLGLVEQAERALQEVPVPERDDDALLLAQLQHVLGANYRSQLIVRSRFGRELRAPLGQSTQGLFELAFPRAYDRSVASAASTYGVPPELVYAIMRQESTFRAYVVSPANAQGLLQLIPATAQRIAAQLGEPSPATFTRPDVNIRLGVAYLSRLFDNFHGNPALAAAAYNAGPTAVDHWLLRYRDLPADVFVEEIPFRETRDYVKKVVANFAAYRRIYRQAPTLLGEWLEPLPAASKGVIDY